MQNINEYLLKTHVKQSTNNERTSQHDYLLNWQWFNTLVTNVDLSWQKYYDMFKNLNDKEIYVWIKEIQTSCVGTELEDDANDINDAKSLAMFYADNPFED